MRASSGWRLCSALRGSWDLVTRGIIKVTTLITPLRVLITLLTKSHDPPSLNAHPKSYEAPLAEFTQEAEMPGLGRHAPRSCCCSMLLRCSLELRTRCRFRSQWCVGWCSGAAGVKPVFRSRRYLSLSPIFETFGASQT